MEEKQDSDLVLVSKSAVLHKFSQVKRETYRKGFQKGYFRAICDYSDLLDENILTQVVFDTLLMYWKDGLEHWNPGENFSRFQPPTFSEWLEENFEWLDDYFKKTKRRNGLVFRKK